MCASNSEGDSNRADTQAAFHELVDRYANEMFRLAFSLVGNAADAEDVVQETFTGAFQGLAGFEGRSSVRTWLTRILVNQAAKCRRSRKVRRTVPLERLSPASGATRGPAEPEAARTDLGMRMDVVAMLDRLSPEHREVIALREFQGMSYDEMSRVLDVPRGTIESRLFRAREELRGLLKSYVS